jgi:hypothetical protein
MSRLDRQFAAMRQEAMRKPLTRAHRFVLPDVELPGGILIGLSLNK